MLLQSAAIGAKKLLVDDKITACLKEICPLSIEADAKIHELPLQRVDWSVLWKSALQIKYRALISGITYFAHLNDYILLENFKLQNLLNTWHTRGFDRSFFNTITQCCLLYSLFRLPLKQPKYKRFNPRTYKGGGGGGGGRKCHSPIRFFWVFFPRG